MGLEIAMQLGWKMPDAIIYPAPAAAPASSACTRDSRNCWNWAGWRATLPKFIAVQAHRLPAYRQGLQRGQGHRGAVG